MLLSAWCCERCCLVLLLLAVSVRANNYSCPTWFYYNTTTQRCECGLEEPCILCDQQTITAQIQNGYCVSYSGHDELYFFCECSLTYKFSRTNRLFAEGPTDPDLLEDTKGLCCERCLSGYAPGVYSFDRKCSDCSETSIFQAICLYLLVDLIPITVLFFPLIIKPISGQFLGYVLFCQGLSYMIEFDLLLWSNCIHSHSSMLNYSIIHVG